MIKSLLISMILIWLHTFPMNANADFDIGYLQDFGISNMLGLAVNPDNGNIFLTSLSYGGQDNLWEFASNGILVYSTRVAFDTGRWGSINSLCIGDNGHLFAAAAKSINLIDKPLEFERYVIEFSQDGSIVYSSFRTDNYSGGTFGIAYNSDNNHLLIATGRVNVEFIIRETNIDGTLIKSYILNPMNWPDDIAYDPLSQSIFALRGSANILDEYSLDSKGNYYLSNSYDLNSVGIPRGYCYALDINRSNGLFYVQVHNERVVEFDGNDLISIFDDAESTGGGGGGG